VTTEIITQRPLLRSALGAVLRSSRMNQGRTLRDVAESARVSSGYLSELERGRKEVSSEVLRSVCDALGLDISVVLVRAAGLMTNNVDAELLAA